MPSRSSSVPVTRDGSSKFVQVEPGRAARKQRAPLVRAVADRDHVVPRTIHEAVQCLGRVGTKVYPYLLHRADRQGVNTGRLRSHLALGAELCVHRNRTRVCVIRPPDHGEPGLKGQEPANEPDGQSGANTLRPDESRRIPRSNAGEGIGGRPRERHSRVCEGG